MSAAGARGRAAGPADAAAITRIYNQGIEEGAATFETRPRTETDVLAWFGGRFPVVVVESEGVVVAFAGTSEYRSRDCYAGIAEFSVYVDRARRGSGLGRVAMETLVDAARAAGFWKLVSRVFVENLQSRALLEDVGFREVGIYQRHAQSRGVWKDVVIVERLLNDEE
jgi:L-amino acid N-acyltransferase YncA